MSLLLCPECYFWVEPYGERCPDCWQVLDAAAPDPSLDELSMAIGDVTACLGEISIRRKALPNRGMLYATTNGIYFLPHKSVFVMQYVATTENEHPFLWSVASFIWSPLILVLPFIRPKKMSEQLVQVSQPQFLSRIDSHKLPKLLMEDPGVFFVPRTAIRQIERRWNRWVIERRLSSRLIFKPQSDRKRFHDKMSELIATEHWKQCTTAF
ncbi:MAG: hypothetical protein IID46_14000 [Planctomycetes bacterium]|nr:hypothetical protein [Planctomycetota bacterium]